MGRDFSGSKSILRTFLVNIELPLSLHENKVDRNTETKNTDERGRQRQRERGGKNRDSGESDGRGEGKWGRRGRVEGEEVSGKLF